MHLAGRTCTAGTSAPDGHFSGPVAFPAAGLAAGPTAGSPRIPFHAVLPRGDTRRFAGEILPLPPQGLSVVSDIDDTIKVTMVHDRRAMLENTFLEPYRAPPGMPALYRKLLAAGASFHYVSSSPWQLYAPLRDFAGAAGFPPGTYHLRSCRWKDRTFVEFLGSGEEHKKRTIEALLRDFPARRFVLVGDTGEKDPEIYGEIARAHPGQVHRILLRDPVAGGEVTPRLERALEDVPRERWEVFKDPAGIEWKVE